MKSLYVCDNTDLTQTASLCKARGLGIEVQSFYHPDALGRPEPVETHRQALEGISHRSMHGPFSDLCPGSFDPMVRDLARQRFEAAYKIALQLGISDIVLHHGYVPRTSSPKGYLQRSLEFWNSFLEAKLNSVHIHLENLLEWEPDLLFDLIAAAGRCNLDVNLDIGHAHCNSRVPVTKWIEKLGSKIGYVHLHDNHGEKDEHLGFGQGTLPLEETCHCLEAYAPEAIWAVESEGVDNIIQSLEWLQQHGFTEKKAENAL